MFSVVIPVYNKEKYIIDAVKSVLNQSYQEFEMLIVDDGSTDQSIKLVSELIDDRIKVIRQENAGVSKARNTGILNSKFNYIAFLDADDVWNIDFLICIKKMIETDPHAGLYFTNYAQVSDVNEINIAHSSNNIIQNIDDYFNHALQKNKLVWTSATVINNTINSEQTLFDESLSRGEDVKLWSTIALQNNFVYCNYLGAFYNREDVKSLSQTKHDISKSFSNISREFYLDNKFKAKNRESFKHFMENISLSKAKYFTLNLKRKEARLILKMNKNKYNKKKAYIMYIITFLPQFVCQKLYN